MRAKCVVAAGSIRSAKKRPVASFAAMRSLEPFPPPAILAFVAQSFPASVLALLLLLVELFLLRVVEERANLIVRVLADLHHLLARRLPVAAGIISCIFHFLLSVHENRLDFGLLTGRQIEVLGHSFQLLIRGHRPPLAAGVGPLRAGLREEVRLGDGETASS